MALATDISCDGTIQRTAFEIEEIQAELITIIQSEFDTIWEQIKNKAIELCPKETGALASSIEIESEGGSGAIMVSGNAGGEGGDFYSNTIFAGNENVINPKSGEPTDLYALFVHDGHATRDGGFYEGVPFLTYAVDFYENELDSIVDTAMSELGLNGEGT